MISVVVFLNSQIEKCYLSKYFIAFIKKKGFYYQGHWIYQNSYLKIYYQIQNPQKSNSEALARSTSAKWSLNPRLKSINANTPRAFWTRRVNGQWKNTASKFEIFTARISTEYVIFWFLILFSFNRVRPKYWNKMQ